MNTQKIKTILQNELKVALLTHNRCHAKIYTEIVQSIVTAPAIENPDGLAKFYDYETDKLLEIATNKKAFCRKLIKEINSAYGQTLELAPRQTLQTLKENLLGKLFYISLQDHKFLIIDQLSPLAHKKELLAELEIIQISEEKAILYFDMLERGPHRNFINGIISYLY